MNLPFNGVRDFFQWLKAVIIMIPITILVVVVGVIFYLTVRYPNDKGGGAGGGYCDHFDDLI